MSTLIHNIWLILFGILITSKCYGEKSFNEMFNEFLKEIPALQTSASYQAKEYNREVQTQYKEYTDNPKETAHYAEDKLDTINMEQEATKEAAPSDNEEDDKKNYGKTVTRSFRTRPVIKIDNDDPILKKGREIENNPEEYSRIAVKKNAGCFKKKVQDCKGTPAGEKRCTEQVRFLQTCDAEARVVMKDMPYPNCQTKRTRPSGKEECLIGRFDIGSHPVTLPRFRAARVEVDGSRHGYFYVSVKNETTGEQIYQHAHMKNGVSFDIAPAGNKNEEYTLIAERADGCNCHLPGYLTLYIDNIAKEPVIESWENVKCDELH